MKIHLAADYKSYSTFYPIYSFGGKLIAVKLMTHFSHSTANVIIPQEMLLPQLDNDQRIILLQKQINSLEKHHDFFCRHGVRMALNIDAPTASLLLDNEILVRKLALLQGLELEINESFTDFTLGCENTCLMALKARFDLSLENYGAGKASSKAAYDNLFTTIKLDKGFIQQNINKLSFRPFINAMLEHIKPHCQRVIIQGVDDLSGLDRISEFPFDGIQSTLFSSASDESLESLIHPPEAFAERQF
ncbi:EAL domain-containing protein [Erwinia sp. P6884]|uniref:EAL domain-containing protein n=1 Tax=Erwinia sp. P6884 TaxID=3141450 RepID=UPI00318C5CE9